MRTTLRTLLFVLPALGLAGCGSPPRTLVSAPPPPPPPPAISGAFVAPQELASAPGSSGSSVAPAAAPGAAIRLQASDTLALLANNTAVGLTDAGVPYLVYFANDGVARFREETLADSGTWRVLPDGTVCSRLPRVAQGAESCYALSRYGDVILYHRPDGLAMGSIRVISGNPQNL
jgi:hypothetical protein